MAKAEHTRRGFLTGLLAVAAPAIVPAAHLMPVRTIPVFESEVIKTEGIWRAAYRVKYLVVDGESQMEWERIVRLDDPAPIDWRPVTLDSLVARAA